MLSLELKYFVFTLFVTTFILLRLCYNIMETVNVSIIPLHPRSMNEKLQKDKCFFNPARFRGQLVVNRTSPSDFNEVLFQLYTRGILQNINPGGHSTPVQCRSEKSVAIIIPYKNRKKQLLMFLRHMHPILQRQRLNYRIFVIEQSDQHPFNRAKLFNVGYNEAITTYKRHFFTCFVFHDVDLLVENDQNSYSCKTSPRYMCPAIDIWRYTSFSDRSFGGVVSFTRDDFESVNGYSNKYWGWGSEDDDMYWRLHHTGKKVTRPNLKIGRYTMIAHKKQESNGVAITMLLKTEKGDLDLKENGLSTLKYIVKKRVHHSLYTHINVDLQMTKAEQNLTTVKSKQTKS